MIWKRKRLTALCAVGVLLLGFTVKTYGVGERLTTEQLDIPNAQENIYVIAEQVIQDTNHANRYQPEYAQNIDVYYGNVAGDEQEEAIIVLQLGPKDTIVAVYEPDGKGGYEYLGEVGIFFQVNKIEFMPIQQLDYDVLIVREEANQNIGAFENSSFIHGYAWRGDHFSMVLNLPERVVATWNKLWDEGNAAGASDWRKITETSDIQWEDRVEPVLTLRKDQSYLVSSDTVSKNIPNDSTFSEISQRSVVEVQTWSNDWQRFIMYEMIETATGETVAVIEDLALSPYALLSDYGDNAQLVRIVRKNDETDVVNRSTLREPNRSQTTPVFQMMFA